MQQLSVSCIQLMSVSWPQICAGAPSGAEQAACACIVHASHHAMYTPSSPHSELTETATLTVWQQGGAICGLACCVHVVLVALPDRRGGVLIVLAALPNVDIVVHWPAVVGIVVRGVHRAVAV